MNVVELDSIIVIHGIHHIGSLDKDHLTNRCLNEIALLRSTKVADSDCLTIQLRPALEARQHDGPAIERVDGRASHARDATWVAPFGP